MAMSLSIVGLASSNASTPCTDSVVCPATIYYGVSLPGGLKDTTGLNAYGSTVGKAPTIVNYFASFADNLDVTSMTALAGQGRLPMVTWTPSDAHNVTDNAYPLSSIAAGTYDAYLIKQAKALATVPGKVVLRFAHEMNGNWYSWGRGVNGNTDAAYVAAFRHVHDVLTAAGATNVIWVWAPGATDPATDVSGLWPGAAYVDWVGLSVYFQTPTETFAHLMNPVIANINSFAPSTPIFVAETSVLPGTGRPAQITDLMQGLIHLPRLVGITWFEEPGRTYDYRVVGDPPALAALSAALTSPWISAAGDTTPPQLAPLSQVAPVVTGTPATNSSLSATIGTWRSSAGTGGTAAFGANWYRCANPTDTGTCAPISGATAAGYTPVMADWNTYLRYQVTAGNSAGSTIAYSTATGGVLTQPAAPPAPAVESENGALKVTFPAVPPGATHWLLTVAGAAKVPEPVSTTTYWLSGLTNGQSYPLALQAEDISTAGTKASAAVAVTAVPMTGPSTPGLTVTGDTAVFAMPKVPTGAGAWLLTVDSVTRQLPTSTTSWTAAGLAPGSGHTWALAPAAGSGRSGSGAWGSTGAPSSGTWTTVADPTAPTVTPISGGATFAFAALPLGASGWQLSVGPTTYPITNAASTTVTGLSPGWAASWSLRAVNSGARSVTVGGKVTALP